MCVTSKLRPMQAHSLTPYFGRDPTLSLQIGWSGPSPDPPPHPSTQRSNVCLGGLDPYPRDSTLALVGMVGRESVTKTQSLT